MARAACVATIGHRCRNSAFSMIFFTNEFQFLWAFNRIYLIPFYIQYFFYRCCFQPCFYQDIQVEIQPEFQRIVRHLYYMWGYYAILLTSNAVAALLLLLFSGGEYSFGHFLFALIYGALFTPASFLCW